MTTMLQMQDQLAEIRMLMDRDDPMHVEAEAAFAVMIAEIMHGAGIAENAALVGSQPMTAERGTPTAKSIRRAPRRPSTREKTRSTPRPPRGPPQISTRGRQRGSTRQKSRLA
jgi:hypothetical protein